MNNIISNKGIRQVRKFKELSHIFDSFNDNAQKLEASYRQLQGRVREIDREMAYTNECLNKKVQELNDLTSYLNSILESMHSGVVAIDISGKITTFNEAAEKILKVNAKGVIGKDIRNALNHISGFTDLLVELLSKRKNIVNLERIIGTKNGSTKYIESSISILKDGRGKITGIVEIFQDLSEIYELKGRLHSANNLVSVGTMAASIAHEIRNPLNGIEGFASLLEREITSSNGLTGMATFKRGGDSLKLVKNIIQGAKNINKIVTDLLLLARPIKLNLRKYKLTEIIDRSLIFISQELSQKNSKSILVNKNYSCQNDIILCDPERLQQAFLNIMLNAVQSMNEGGEITVFTQELTLDGGQGIQVGFTDTGDGISNYAIKKVFEPFFTTKDDGTGLGLVIVRKIIELHDGQVTISSKHKQGTTFLVDLPQDQHVKLKPLKDTNFLSNVVA
ncbi:MAG: nitrogen regulation protein NR(II) [Candidatus Scalinduaceae bacterium]